MFLAYVCPGYSTKISASLGAASVISTVAGGACAETFCRPLEPQPTRAASSAIGKTPDHLDNFTCHPPSAIIMGQSIRLQVSPLGFSQKRYGAGVCNDTEPAAILWAEFLLAKQ